MASTFKPPPNWASAPAFVPRAMPPASSVSAHDIVPDSAASSPQPSLGQVFPAELDITKIKEFVPRSEQQGGIQGASLPDTDVSEIRDSVPGFNSNGSEEDMTNPYANEFTGTQDQIGETYGHDFYGEGYLFPSTSGYGFDFAADEYNAGQVDPWIIDQSADLDLGIEIAPGLCKYFVMGLCRYGDNCSFIHGTACEYCNLCVLHPDDEKLNSNHLRNCVKEHEKDMELAFAAAQATTEHSCGVCYENVLEKHPPGQRRFGILPSCSHCFCLDCIRRWRKTLQIDSNKTVRGCPLCRTTSDFVVPSRVWVESKEEKDKLVQNYKDALGRKPCRNFKQGAGSCPFGNKCFYQHALPDGTPVDCGPPRRRRKRINLSALGGGVGGILGAFDDANVAYEDLLLLLASAPDSDWSSAYSADPSDEEEDW